MIEKVLAQALKQREAEIVKELEKMITDMMKEYANTPLQKRESGFAYLNKARKKAIQIIKNK